MMSKFSSQLSPSDLDSIFNSIQKAIEAATASPSHKIERSKDRPTVEVNVENCLEKPCKGQPTDHG
jgi:hypothetical protein